MAGLALSTIAAGLGFVHTATPPVAEATVATTIRDAPVGEVYGTTTTAQGITYAVGSFSAAGAWTGGAARLATDDSSLDRTFPQVVGNVETVIPDSSGGYYIGGSFTVVGGKPRAGLARILADGTVSDAWVPTIGSNTSVLTMVLRDDTVYLGGSFTTINGTTRNRLAAVSATTGALSSWDPSASASVSTLATDDSALYVGGSFTTISSTTRNRIAAYDIVTGALLSWNPGSNGSVNTLKSTGSVVYVGGNFTDIGGSSPNNLAAVNAVATGNSNVTSFNPTIGSTVNAVGFDDSTVYAVGTFTTAGNPSQTRNYAAAFARDTGTLSAPWNPNLGSWGLSLQVVSDGVWISGYFTTVNGSASRSMLAKVNKTTGTVASFDGGLYRSGGEGVKSIALSGSGSSVVAAGDFAYAKSQSRTNAAAFGSNGLLTNWAPAFNSNANDIAVVGSTAYVVGSFTTVNGSTTRNRAAAISTDDTGSIRSWNPNFSNYVQDIEISGNRAYVAGGFTTAQGGAVTRNSAAAVLLDDTGTVTDWSPNLNQVAYKVTIRDGVAYVGGNYTLVNGSVTRNRAAAFRTDDTGTVLGWNPNVNGSVWDIQFAHGLAYLAGEFSSVNSSTTRNRFAAVALDDSAIATAWSPTTLCESAVSSRCNSEQPIGYTIAVAGTVAYLGGRFTTVSGTRNLFGLAAVNTDDTGTVASSWLPTVSFATTSSLPNTRKITYASGAVSIAGRTGGVALAGTPYTANLTALPAIQSEPAAPSGISATAGDAEVSVAWSVGSTGGSPVTLVEFALDDTTAVDDSTTSTSSPHVISGLTNGTAYTVYVRLVNAVGPGPWSAASAPFTPQSSAPTPPPPAIPPGPPTGVTAIAGTSSADVSWTPPTDTGSFPVSSYIVRSHPGSHLCLTESTTCTVENLTGDTPYTFTVQALSGAGVGPASAPSAPVTPQPRPQPGILISGSRNSDNMRIVKITGRVTDLDVDEVHVRYRLAGQQGFRTAVVAPAVIDGAFTWQRVTNRRITVYVTAQGRESNTIVIRAT